MRIEQILKHVTMTTKLRKHVILTYHAINFDDFEKFDLKQTMPISIWFVGLFY